MRARLGSVPLLCFILVAFRLVCADQRGQREGRAAEAGPGTATLARFEIPELSVAELHAVEDADRALTSFRAKGSCFADAVERISQGCRSLEADDASKIRLAVQLALCELSHSHVAAPQECRPEELDRDAGRCIAQLGRSPQSWTSYSTSLKDVVRLCFASQFSVQRKHLEALRSNLTVLHLKTANLLIDHHEANLKQWKLAHLAGERVERSLGTIENKQSAVLGVAQRLVDEARSMQETIQNGFRETGEAIAGTRKGIGEIRGDVAGLHSLAQRAVKTGIAKADQMSDALDRLQKLQEARFTALSVQQDVVLARWSEGLARAHEDLESLLVSAKQATSDRRELLDGIAALGAAVEMLARGSFRPHLLLRETAAYCAALAASWLVSLFSSRGGRVRMACIAAVPVPSVAGFLAGRHGFSAQHASAAAAAIALAAIVALVYSGLRWDSLRAEEEEQKRRREEAFQSAVIRWQLEQPKAPEASTRRDADAESEPATPVRASRRTTPAKKKAPRDAARGDEE